MKTKTLFQACNLHFALILMYVMMTTSAVSASPVIEDNETDKANSVVVLLRGKWGSIRSRSVDEIPLSATINNNTLNIQNTGSGCALTIKITNSLTAQTVIEEEIPDDETLIVIPLHFLPDGHYTLEIENDFGGYIYGSFVKETNKY